MDAPLPQATARRFEMALRSAGMGTWRWEITTGLVDWDEPMQELWGFEPGAFPGTYDAYIARLDPRDRARQIAAIRDVIDRRLPTMEVEHRLVLPDGTRRWVRSTARLHLDDAGNPRELMGVAVDVTRRREAEAARRRAEDAERRALAAARAGQRHLRVLARMSQLVGTPLDVALTLRAVAGLAVEELADRCIAHAWAAGGPDVQEVACPPHESDVDPRLPAAVRHALADPDALARLRADHVLHLRDLTADLAARTLPDDTLRLAADHHITGALVVPLTSRGATAGTLTLLAGPDRPFTAADISLARELGRRGGSALEKARLYAERDRIAGQLQQALRPPHLPDVPGVAIGTAFRPWTAGVDVGGDFYDVIPAPDGAWVVLGDVCGKGPAAAATSASVRAAVRALVRHDQDPAGVLRHLNEVLVDSDRALDAGHPAHAAIDAFLTLVLARVRRVPGGLGMALACGGHPRPVLRCADGRVEQIDVSGTLIGLLPHVDVTTVHVHLAPGDAVLLFTDGLTEAEGPLGHQVGEAGVLAAVAAVAARPTHELAQAVTARVLGGAVRVRDDVAALAVGPASATRP